MKSLKIKYIVFHFVLSRFNKVKTASFITKTFNPQEYEFTTKVRQDRYDIKETIKPLSAIKRKDFSTGDMEYTKPNINRQMKNYFSIREVGGLDAVNDVYARADNSTNVFWFVGKVARCTGTVSLELAIQRQWNLIEEHATRLRPIELGRSLGKLQLWTALGDSELHILNQLANYEMEQIPRYKAKDGNDSNDGEADVCNESIVRRIEVGFNFEVVTNFGEGLRVERTKDGNALLN